MEQSIRKHARKLRPGERCGKQLVSNAHNVHADLRGLCHCWSVRSEQSSRPVCTWTPPKLLSGTC